MKKQILKTAVVAAIVLPMAAQAGVYGRADGVVRYLDDGLAGGNSVWDIGVDKMRWGIVGSEDLGNGMKALYHYEWAMSNGGTTGSTSNNESTRLAYAGLEGGWGKLLIGRQWAPSYFAVYNKTDTGDAHATGADQNNLSGNRHGKSITYTSPDMSGFSFSAFGMMDGDGQTQEDTLDKWELSAQYKNGPLQIGGAFGTDERGSAASAASGSAANVCFQTTSATSNCTAATTSIVTLTSASAADNNEIDTWGIGGSYAFGDLSIEASYVDWDDGTVERDGFNIGATYKMGSTQIHGAYRDQDEEEAGVADIESTDWYIGVRHFMSKETRVFAEYLQREQEQGATDLVDDSMFAVGLRKDWKL